MNPNYDDKRKLLMKEYEEPFGSKLGFYAMITFGILLFIWTFLVLFNIGVFT